MTSGLEMEHALFGSPHGASGYQSTRHTVISSHGQLGTGQLVTDTSRHTVNSSHNKTTAMPCSLVSLFGFNVTIIARMTSDNGYLWALKLKRNDTLHIYVQHSKLLQRMQCRSHWRRWSSWMWRML